MLIAEADRLFADLPIRHLLITDTQAAKRLWPGLVEGGYREAVLVTMLMRRPPDRGPADLVELTTVRRTWSFWWPGALRQGGQTTRSCLPMTANEEGCYAAVCFFTYRAGGPPHFAKGQIAELTVE